MMSPGDMGPKGLKGSNGEGYRGPAGPPGRPGEQKAFFISPSFWETSSVIKSFWGLFHHPYLGVLSTFDQNGSRTVCSFTFLIHMWVDPISVFSRNTFSHNLAVM